MSAYPALPVSAPAVDATRLVKLFGATPALVQVDLRVERGVVGALVGGNGAGKTTLLGLIATALRPTSGELLVLGLDASASARATDVRRRLDLLPAAGGVYPELTAVENLRFALRMRGRAADAAELQAALARMGLGEVAHERVGTYSTGMRRRVALARLVLVGPELALLDEPYAGLDEDGRGLVDRVVDEARAEGRTVLLATHERERAAALADVVHRLERGVLVESSLGRGAERTTFAMAEAHA